MLFFNKTKKKLEEERQERQRLENELAERQRKEQLERQEMEQFHQRQMEQAMQQLENTRLAQEQLERQEKERQIIEWEKRQIEEKRLQREAQQRQEKQRKIKEASPETLRSLRELIRDKYRLDVEIWGLRGARKPDRWVVEQKMEKADAVMQEIMAMVGLWEDNRDESWDPAEWERVQDIRRRLQSGGIRIWADSLLWSEARESGVYGRESGVYRRESTVHPH